MPKRGHQPRGLLPGDPGQFLVTVSSTLVDQGSTVEAFAQYATSEGSPVARSGLTVTWGKTGSGGTFNNATSTTDVAGVAKVQFTVGTVVGATYAITAAASGGIAGTSPTITVSADDVPDSIVLTPATLSLVAGGTSTITATLKNKIGGTIAGATPTDWITSDPTIATVANGLVTAVAPGSVAITARYGAILSNAVSLTVTTNIAPASITLVAISVPLSVGTVQMTANVKNGTGDPVPGVTPTGWTSSDPTVASINATSGLLTVLKVGSTNIQASLGSILSNTVAVTVTQITTSSAVLALEGPTIPSSAMAALGLSYYETLFSVNAEQQWTDFNKAWDAGNTISVYERPATFWVWALRTGDQKWFTRADAMLKDYRDRFLLANAGNDPAQVNPSAHFSQAESLYLHWKITGDTLSRDCAVSIATHAIAYTLGYLTNLAGPVDARIQARVLVAFYIGVLIKGENYQPSDQNPTTYGQYLDQCITDVLGTMNADGYAEFASTCGGSLNYMCGMLADILTRIYDQRPGTYNATILTKMTALGTYLWNTQWRGGGSDASFNYNSVFCAGTGSATSAPDENGLIAPLFGWLYKTTADAAWKTKGDQILAGMQQAGGIYLYRQFSELFDSSYRYLGYAHPDHLLT